MPGQSGSAAPFNAKYILNELMPELPNAVLHTDVLTVHQLDGNKHTVSGLTVGQILRALSASSFGFAAVQDGDLPSTIVRTSRQITAGAGLSGGGDLSADRTLAVDTTVVRKPGSLTQFRIPYADGNGELIDTLNILLDASGNLTLPNALVVTNNLDVSTITFDGFTLKTGSQERGAAGTRFACQGALDYGGSGCNFKATLQNVPSSITLTRNGGSNDQSVEALNVTNIGFTLSIRGTAGGGIDTYWLGRYDTVGN